MTALLAGRVSTANKVSGMSCNKVAISKTLDGGGQGNLWLHGNE